MIELGYESSSDAFESGYRYLPISSFSSPGTFLRCHQPFLSLFLVQHHANQANLTSIYISGDTLLVAELNEIPKRYAGQNIDLMLVHLGGTTLPSPSVPLLMVTMDADQGLKLVQLIEPDLTIPIHYEYV